MEVGDMQKVTAVWLRKTHAWQPPLAKNNMGCHAATCLSEVCLLV